MNTNSKILITGAAGFIASCMASFLNKHGYEQLILVDDFSKDDKLRNHQNITCLAKVDRNQIEDFLQTNEDIDSIIHFGARTDTTEMDYTIHEKLNVESSIFYWNYCTKHQIPFLYASSAATYGDGEFGYDDNHEIINKLLPLNPYGVSKNEFDKYAIAQSDLKNCPPHWYGFKFFNVYGPNEYHKGRMASVVYHAFHQIKEKGCLRLFRSHHPDYKDGGQMRDFIYVKDILDITFWVMNHLPANGIYNAGTGQAATFLQLAEAIFHAMEIEASIEFIDTPLDIREKYQYFTEANMQKLRDAGYSKDFYSIDNGVQEYVREYLSKGNYY